MLVKFENQPDFFRRKFRKKLDLIAVIHQYICIKKSVTTR